MNGLRKGDLGDAFLRLDKGAFRSLCRLAGKDEIVRLVRVSHQRFGLRQGRGEGLAARLQGVPGLASVGGRLLSPVSAGLGFGQGCSRPLEGTSRGIQARLKRHQGLLSRRLLALGQGQGFLGLGMSRPGLPHGLLGCTSGRSGHHDDLCRSLCSDPGLVCRFLEFLDPGAMGLQGFTRLFRSLLDLGQGLLGLVRSCGGP